MPIGGGTWTLMNKVLPGAYINFISLATTATPGTRGIATLPLSLNWGPDNQIIRIDAAEFNKEALTLLGYAPTATELLLIREALKRAVTLLAYRVNSGGVKATAAIGGVAITAKYTGTRGNDLKVAVQANIDEPSLFDVSTYLAGSLVDTQTVVAAEHLIANDFVSFGAGTLHTAAASPLSGGTNGNATGEQYAAYLNAVEVETFNVIGYPGTDVSTKNLIAAFVKRLRDDEGVKVVGVLANYPGDHEGLINVKNGVKLNTGETLPAEQAVAWVTGASAGAEINQSLTDNTYEGAVDVDIKYTKSQYIAAINAGEFVFFADSGRARVLADINSLTTTTPLKSGDFTSNRVIRVLDAWGNDVARIFGENYVGNVTNNDTGRNLFKADLVSLAGEYQRVEAISSFTPDDIDIQQGQGKRDVLVNMSLQPNDAMEKLYMSVLVR